MAGTNEPNPVIQKTSSSKKNKSKSGKSSHRHSGKSGHHEEQHEEHHERQEGSGQSRGQGEDVQGQPETSGRIEQAVGSEQERDAQGKGKKKKVHFSEEPSSKRQRVEEEDDLTVYRDGALESVSAKFETSIPIFNHGLFINLDKLDELGFAHLRPYLEKYMPWLGINQDYNVNVLRVFCQSLSGRAKYRKVDGKEQVHKLSFTATVRGRTFRFTWRTLNEMMGITEEDMNEWIYPESHKYSKEELEELYGTNSKKVSKMSDSNRLLYYVYSRIMTHKGGNFNEFTLLDNPWFPRLLSRKPFNPGQLICLELQRWLNNDKSGYLPYPTIIAFLLEKHLIKATSVVEEENVQCRPVGATNVARMGIKYFKPPKPTRSHSQASSASGTSAPSASGAGDQEVDSHAGPSRSARVPASVRAFAEDIKEELLLRLTDSLVGPLRVECEAGFHHQGERIQRLEDRVGQLENHLARVDAKLDLILQHLQIPQPSSQGNLPPSPPPPPQNPPPPPNHPQLPPPPPPNTQQPQPPPQNDQQAPPSPNNDQQSQPSPTHDHQTQDSTHNSPRHSPRNFSSSPSSSSSSPIPTRPGAPTRSPLRFSNPTHPSPRPIGSETAIHPLSQPYGEYPRLQPLSDDHLPFTPDSANYKEYSSTHPYGDIFVTTSCFPDPPQTPEHLSSPTSSTSTLSPSPPKKFGPEPPPSSSTSTPSLALTPVDDDKRGRNVMSTLRLSMATRDVLSQPSLWIDEDITAALRRAYESQRLSGAESLIRGEALRFMEQKRTAEQRSHLEMVVFGQNEQSSQSESSSEPSPNKTSREMVEEIIMKWGLKRPNHPPIVIAKPVPASSGQESEIPSSEQSSDPPPSSEPAARFSAPRKKAVARKRARKLIATTESDESEEETPSDLPEQGTSSAQVVQENPVVQAVPILKEVKLEIEDMTPEEFEKYGFTDKLSFGQMACLDAERASAMLTPPINKSKGKSKGKGKRKAQEVEEDPNFSAWNVRIRAVHYPNGEVSYFDDATGFPGYEEVENMKRAYEESIESERLRREKEEKELQEIIAQINQSEREENEERQKEREKKKRHKL